jgi:ABC-type sugar transport system ATPase subunit
MNLLPSDAGRIGIRPERLTLCNPGEGDRNCAVEFIEFLGDKFHIHLTLADGQRIIAATTAACPVKRGDAVGIRLDPAALHRFDEHGRRQT